MKACRWLHKPTPQQTMSIPLFLVCSLTHSIAKNVDYGTHEKGAHPVESDGSITVPVQNMTHNHCNKPTQYPLKTSPMTKSSYPQVMAAIMSKYMR